MYTNSSVVNRFLYCGNLEIVYTINFTIDKRGFYGV